MKNKLASLNLGICSLFFLGFGVDNNLNTPTTEVTIDTSSDTNFNYTIELSKASALIQDAMNNTPIQYVNHENNILILLANNNLSFNIESTLSPTVLNSHQGYSLITLKINDGVSAEIFYAWNKALTKDGINHYDMGCRALSATNIMDSNLNYFRACNDINKSHKTDLNDLFCLNMAEFLAQHRFSLKMKAELKHEINGTDKHMKLYFSNITITSRENNKNIPNFNVIINPDFTRNIAEYLFNNV